MKSYDLVIQPADYVEISRKKPVDKLEKVIFKEYKVNISNDKMKKIVISNRNISPYAMDGVRPAPDSMPLAIRLTARPGVAPCTPVRPTTL